MLCMLYIVDAYKEDEECDICMDVTAEAVQATPCQHYFHMSCLAEWLGLAQREVDREDCFCCRGRLSGLRRKLVKR